MADKYAVRVTDGSKSKLVSVVKDKDVQDARNNAKEGIDKGSSEWVSVKKW